MSRLEHPLTREELMAYADGELEGLDASKLKHIQECGDCSAAVADAQHLSTQLASWEIEDAPGRVAENVLNALPKQPQRAGWWTPGRKWVYGVGGVAAASLLLLTLITPSLLRSRQAAMESGPPRFAAPIIAAIPEQAASAVAARSGPMVIRSLTLTIVTKEFDASRSRIDAIVRQAQGYIDKLTLHGDPGSSRGLFATLRVPADQAESALAELRKVGQVMQESQNSSDVTSQYVDLNARLSNSRNSEQRLLNLLRDRAGDLKDVIAMEREISSVRETIERMQAEQKDLNNKVQYVTLQVELNEEYRAEVQPPKPSIGSELRNASIDGVHYATDTLVGLALFTLRYVPALLIWVGVIGTLIILGNRIRLRLS